MQRIELVIVDDVGQAVLYENDSFEQKFDVKLPEYLLLALVSIVHFRPVKHAANLFAKLVDVVPNEVEKVHSQVVFLFLLQPYYFL